MAMATNDDEWLKEHRKTFEGFTRLLTYSTIGVIVVLIGMAIFLL